LEAHHHHLSQSLVRVPGPPLIEQEGREERGIRSNRFQGRKRSKNYKGTKPSPTITASLHQDWEGNRPSGMTNLKGKERKEDEELPSKHFHPLIRTSMWSGDGLVACFQLPQVGSGESKRDRSITRLYCIFS